jgi:hypothetical protein
MSKEYEQPVSDQANKQVESTDSTVDQSGEQQLEGNGAAQEELHSITPPPLPDNSSLLADAEMELDSYAQTEGVMAPVSECATAIETLGPLIADESVTQLTSSEGQESGEQSAAPLPAIDKAEGLSSEISIAGYANRAAALEQNWYGKSAEERAKYLHNYANDVLESIQVPKTNCLVEDTGGDYAAFYKHDWSMKVNEGLFNMEHVVRDAPDGQFSLGTAVESIWHESRHAEQAFRAAQWAAGQPNYIQGTVAKDWGIDPKTAVEAEASPLLSGEAGSATAQAWVADYFLPERQAQYAATRKDCAVWGEQSKASYKEYSDHQTEFCALQNEYTTATNTFTASEEAFKRKCAEYDSTAGTYTAEQKQQLEAQLMSEYQGVEAKRRAMYDLRSRVNLKQARQRSLTETWREASENFRLHYNIYLNYLVELDAHGIGDKAKKAYLQSVTSNPPPPPPPKMPGPPPLPPELVS